VRADPGQSGEEIAMGIRVDGMTPLIEVFDMPTSLAFYRDVLGFELVASAPPGSGDDFDWGLLRLGETELMLNTAYEKPDRPARPDGGRVRAHADTALFFACPDLDAAYDHLRGRDVPVEPPTTTSYGMRQLHMRDPDGYAICLQWRAR
jgi:catechol 2,3-dioxygenase-like lactoylglutathione lyase family enzyme